MLVDLHACWYTHTHVIFTYVNSFLMTEIKRKCVAYGQINVTFRPLATENGIEEFLLD